MTDRSTRKMQRPGSEAAAEAFLRSYQATLVVLTGPAAGSEHALEGGPVTIGRGPGVDLVFDDDALSREHAVVELVDGGYRIRDLGSTNGIEINGSSLQSAQLKHGDRISLGEHRFQYVIEERDSGPREYEVAEG